MAEALTLHEDPRSGNCYKIRLTAALLGLPLEIDIYDPAALAAPQAAGRLSVLPVPLAAPCR